MTQIIIICKEGKQIIVLNCLIREKIDSSYLIAACYYDGVKVGRNDNEDVIVIFSKLIPVAFEISYFSLPAKENKISQNISRS